MKTLSYFIVLLIILTVFIASIWPAITRLSKGDIEQLKSKENEELDHMWMLIDESLHRLVANIDWINMTDFNFRFYPDKFGGYELEIWLEKYSDSQYVILKKEFQSIYIDRVSKIKLMSFESLGPIRFNDDGDTGNADDCPAKLLLEGVTDSDL